MDLEAAAALLGVHYQTAYRLVRNGVLPAVRVASGYEIDAEDVAVLREERSRRRSSASELGIAWWSEQEQLFTSLLRGDEVVAGQQLDGLQGQGASAVAVCENLISPVMRRLELQQLAGQLVPAEVAAAAQVCERLVGRIAAPLPGRPRGLAVVASPVGEEHRLPSLMATAALRSSRWRVQHLGTGVPAGDLAEFIDETEPTLVVISLTMRTPAAQEFCQLVAASTTVPVVTGGSGERLRDLLGRVEAVTGPKRIRRTEPVDVAVIPEVLPPEETASLFVEA